MSANGRDVSQGSQSLYEHKYKCASYGAFVFSGYSKLHFFGRDRQAGPKALLRAFLVGFSLTGGAARL